MTTISSNILMNFRFCHSTVDLRAYSRAYPHLLPLTPAHSDSCTNINGRMKKAESSTYLPSRFCRPTLLAMVPSSCSLTGVKVNTSQGEIAMRAQSSKASTPNAAEGGLIFLWH